MKAEKPNRQGPFLLPWHSSQFSLSRPKDSNRRIWSPWKSSQILEGVKEVSEWTSFLSSKCGPVMEDRNCWRQEARGEEYGICSFPRLTGTSALSGPGGNTVGMAACSLPSLKLQSWESDSGGQTLGDIFCLWGWMTNYLGPALGKMVWFESHSWSQSEAKEGGIS